MKKILNNLAPGAARSTTSSLSSSKDFFQVIARETNRSNRYGLRLSLAVFEVNSSDENNVIVRRLVRVLHKRIRSADAVGWYAKKQIGVLLPHTPEHGAWKVTEDIYGLLSSSDYLPPYTVYTYPSENWPIKASRKISNLFDSFLSNFMFSRAHTIPNIQETREIINLEMDRAIRHNYIFSLLILDLNVAPEAQNYLKNITRAINTCLRDTDSFGWLAERSLAVVLPYSTDENAREIRDRISARSNLSSQDIFKIYTYPTNWFDKSDDEKNGKDGESDSEPATKEERQVDKSEEQSSVEENVQEDRSSEYRDDRQGAQTSEIEPLLSKPLPFWKRGMDITGSLVGLFFLSPIFILTAILIKLSSPGPVFFCQERVGFHKRKFLLYKFRSMHVHSGSDHHRKFMKKIISDGEIKDTKLKDDPRIFAVGKFIRRSSIDELPQLINVLKGEMSLVGPRPCMDYEADLYLRWHTKRFYAVPGLSGLWQVSGKNRLSFKEMIRLDIYYQKNISLLLDLKIILMTFPAVLSIFFKENDLA